MNKKMNPLSTLLDETPTRLDRLGSAFMEDTNSLQADETFELFADLLDVPESDLINFLNGQQFVTTKFAKMHPETKEETHAI